MLQGREMGRDGVLKQVDYAVLNSRTTGPIPIHEQFWSCYYITLTRPQIDIILRGRHFSPYVILVSYL